MTGDEREAELLERIRASRAAQGLPPHIEDPVVIQRIARAIVNACSEDGTVEAHSPSDPDSTEQAPPPGAGPRG